MAFRHDATLRAARAWFLRRRVLRSRRDGGSVYEWGTQVAPCRRVCVVFRHYKGGESYFPAILPRRFIGRRLGVPDLACNILVELAPLPAFVNYGLGLSALKA